MRILRVHGQVGDANAGPDVEHLLPGRAAIGGAVNTTFLVVVPWTAHGGDDHGVGVVGINRDGRNLEAVLESHTLPVRASVG